MCAGTLWSRIRRESPGGLCAGVGEMWNWTDASEILEAPPRRLLTPRSDLSGGLEATRGACDLSALQLSALQGAGVHLRKWKVWSRIYRPWKTSREASRPLSEAGRSAQAGMDGSDIGDRIADVHFRCWVSESISARRNSGPM